MADAATEIADAVGLLFFFYSAHAVATETALVSVTAVDAVLTTDAIQSSGFYLFFAAVAAVALAADKHPPISSISFENAFMYILIPQI